MAVRRPTLDQLRSVAEDLGMHMGDEELKSYDALMQANYAAYEAVDAMPDYVPAAGQYLPCRRSHDERRLDPRRLHA